MLLSLVGHQKSMVGLDPCDLESLMFLSMVVRYKSMLVLFQNSSLLL